MKTATVLGTQPGSFAGQFRVFVDWPTRRQTCHDASISYQDGRYAGNSGNIPKTWLPACKRAAKLELAATTQPE